MWTIEQLDKLTIKQSNHEPPNGHVEACAMEATYLRWAIRQGWPKKKIVAGWTDTLDCVCPPSRHRRGLPARWRASSRPQRIRRGRAR